MLALSLGIVLSASLPGAAQDLKLSLPGIGPTHPLLPVVRSGAANGGDEQGSRPSQSPAAPCVANANQLDFLYPKIPASFIGGTVAGMPLNRGTLRRLNPFQADQLRVNGSLAIGSCNMVFTFATKQKQVPAIEADASFQVLPCGPAAGAGLSSEGARLCSMEHAGGEGKSRYAIQIPYGEINVLARGRKGPSELNNDTATYLTAATAVVTTILATVSNTHDKELAFGATVLVASAAYFFLIRRPAQGENYVAVFVRKQGDESNTVAAVPPAADKPKAAAGEFLQKGDVLIFRIGNYHDYFNISMILSGKTGLTFVSQGAEKGK